MRRELLAELAAIGYALPGSIVRRTTRCGRPGCRCQADPPVLHGPYLSWIRKSDGKAHHAQAHSRTGAALSALVRQLPPPARPHRRTPSAVRASRRKRRRMAGPATLRIQMTDDEPTHRTSCANYGASPHRAPGQVGGRGSGLPRLPPPAGAGGLARSAAGTSVFLGPVARAEGHCRGPGHRIQGDSPARSRLLLPCRCRSSRNVNRFLRGWAAYFRYGNSAPTRSARSAATPATRLALWLSANGATADRGPAGWGMTQALRLTRTTLGLIEP